MRPTDDHGSAADDALMSQQQEQSSVSGDGEQEGEGQQQQQPQAQGRAGQGSESAMEHLREWEQHRAGNTGGKHRR